MNKKKYQLVDRKPETGLWRIQALRDFDDVRRGDVGGWVSGHSNLSHDGNCWVYDDAIVADSARVDGNAKIRNNAKIFDNARIFNSAQVYDNVKVYENSLVMDNVKIYGQARVRGTAHIFEKAQVYDNAQVFGGATVKGNARIFGNAQVFDYSYVYDNAMISGDSRAGGYSRIFHKAELCDKAKIGENQCIRFDTLKTDITEGRNIEDSLRCQLNMTFDENDEVLCYKTVKSDLTSLHDRKFQYRVGEWAVAKNPDMSTASCASGLHFSYKGYWKTNKDAVELICRVRKEDIITIQDGKIRAKKAFVIRVD